MKRAILVLWPSFLVGGASTVAFFLLLDPVDLRYIGPLEMNRLAGYTLGFFFFWAVAAASSAFSLFLQKGPDEINR